MEAHVDPAGAATPETRERPPWPWAWIPTLYLAEGLPYVLVMTVAVIMYKDFPGLTNTQIAFATSALYLPWVIKPLWSPVVDLLGTRRTWIWATQFVAGATLAGVAMATPLPNAFRWTLACFWLLAFDSATHDIAADGFYMLALREDRQAFFVGVRTLFYRIATLAGQGLLVMYAGHLKHQVADPVTAWSRAMMVPAALLAAFGLWHLLILPRPGADRPGDARRVPEFLRAFFATFADFFSKPDIAILILFLVLYRLGEAQLVKMAPPFLLDPRAKGGLGLSTGDVGFIYGTIGPIALAAGGISGGWLISRHGLKAWLWPMLLAIHLPDAVFVWLAYVQPASALPVQVGLAIEQFGYGFGFTAYLMYMMHIARGRHATAHYAICTGFMALGMMIPGMWSGWLADRIGYRHFFVWVILATLPSFLVALRIPLERGFGKQTVRPAAGAPGAR